MEYCGASKLVTLQVIVSDIEGAALAQILPTIDFEKIRPLATDDVQAFHILSGLSALAVALSAVGFSTASV